MSTSIIKGVKKGTITPTLTGWTINYAVSGNVVSIWADHSGSVSFEHWQDFVIATVPAELRPSQTVLGHMSDTGYSYQTKAQCRPRITGSGNMLLGVRDAFTAEEGVSMYFCYVIG